MARPFQRKRYTSEDANTWERTFGKILTPFEKFVESSTGSGILLIVLTVVAMVIANSPWNDTYQHFIHEHLVVSFGEWKIDLSLHHWVNDALMAIFFYLVGLEIKHEMMVGELSSVKKAALPIMAAIGGMIVPALIYFLINRGGDGGAGWGIPMATDIAFAMAILILLGKRIPQSLMTILVALAIVDDLGAVLVIALFYTDTLAFTPLVGAFVCFAVLMGLNLAGVQQVWPYGCIAVVMWVCMLFSGIHATIAGVLCALATPARSIYNPAEFSRDARKLLDRFDVYRDNDKDKDFLSSERLNGILHTLSTGINKAQTPLQHLEHSLKNPVYFVIIPLFVLFNAAVPVDVSQLDVLFRSPVVYGVVAGLLVGKFVGVLGAIFLCDKLGIASLPDGVNYRHITGIAMLAGIGFTMSIFIAELAFSGHTAHLTEAKIAILAASLLAGVLGYVWLFINGRGEAHE